MGKLIERIFVKCPYLCNCQRYVQRRNGIRYHVWQWTYHKNVANFHGPFVLGSCFVLTLKSRPALEWAFLHKRPFAIIWGTWILTQMKTSSKTNLHVEHIACSTCKLANVQSCKTQCLFFVSCMMTNTTMYIIFGARSPNTSRYYRIVAMNFQPHSSSPDDADSFTSLTNQTINGKPFINYYHNQYGSSSPNDMRCGWWFRDARTAANLNRPHPWQRKTTSRTDPSQSRITWIALGYIKYAHMKVGS